MFKQMALTAALLVGTSSVSIANADQYWGVGITKISFETSDEGISVKSEPTAIEGLWGTEFHPHFAGELRLGLGLSDDKLNFSYNGFSGSVGSLKISNYLSAYLRPQFGSDTFKGYALLGFTSINSELSDGEEKVSGNDSELSYGVGGAFLFGSNSVHLEWKSLADIDGADLTALTLGFQRKI